MLVFEKQGALIKAKSIGKSASEIVACKRGIVDSFSSKSRKRMLELFARLDLDKKRVTFVTLTFSTTPTNDEAKAAFKRFRMWLDHNHPQTCGVWRLELQDRGAPHYHLVLIDLPYIPQSLLQKVWERCTRQGMSIVDIRLVRGHQKVVSYVAKYVAKVADVEGASDSERSASLEGVPYQQTAKWQGRFWGVINKAALPFAERVVGFMDDEIYRYFLWSIHARLRRRGIVTISSTMFDQEADLVLEYILKHGGELLTTNIEDDERYKNLLPHQRAKVSLWFAPTHTRPPTLAYIS